MWVGLPRPNHLCRYARHSLTSTALASNQLSRSKLQEKIKITMFSNYIFRKLLVGAFSVVLANAVSAFGYFQVSGVPKPTPVPAPTANDQSWWYVMLFVLAAGLSAAIIWFLRSKTAEKESHAIENEKLKNRQENWDANSVDMNEEMAWLREKQVVTESKRKRDYKQKLKKREELQSAKNAEKLRSVNSKVVSSSDPVSDNELLKGFSPGPLPIFSFDKLKTPDEFIPLPLSNDESLMNAIEQVQDELEEDEEVRDLSLRILMAFRTRNSVEAVSQIALYDLSASLRAKAVAVLADFDHESVFETLLLCCADPTREVRAAAARAITRLTIDRTQAWIRVIQSDDKSRQGQAAYAAIDAGFVDRALDRLVHRDANVAEEAFALLSLLIKADKTEVLTEAVASHLDMNVRQAILHLFKVSRNAKSPQSESASGAASNLPAEKFSEVESNSGAVNIVM